MGQGRAWLVTFGLRYLLIIMFSIHRSIITFVYASLIFPSQDKNLSMFEYSNDEQP